MARILIVDDNLMIRRLLQDILTEGGHEVVGEAADGYAAPVLLREHRPDVVTLDLVMPGRSGLATLPLLLMIDPGVAVVVCSASLSQGHVIDAIRYGARGFIVKPFDRDRVLEGIHEALSDRFGLTSHVHVPDTSSVSRFSGEKREFARVPMRLPVVVEAGSRHTHTVSVNVSGGGVLVEAADLAVGDEVVFRIHLATRQPPVDGQGRVVRLDDEGRPAIAFEAVAVEDHERLVELLYDEPDAEPEPGLLDAVVT